MINVTKQREIVIPAITEFLFNREFIRMNNGEDLFIRDEGNRVLKFNFYFSNSGLSGNTLYTITFKIIEDIIFRAGLANLSIENQLQKYNILSTIYDQDTMYPFTDRPTKIGAPQTHSRIRIETEENLNQWIQAFKGYFLSDGNNFIESHATIGDLNNKMKILRSRGEKSYSKLLLGGIDHLFRALTISKLSNDSYYHQMQKYFDLLILQEKYEKWHLHYKKLKEILNNTAPLSNFEKV